MTGRGSAAATSHVVTGGAGGVGRAIAMRLADAGPVVVIDVADALGWEHPGVRFVSGDATDPEVTREAARVAQEAALALSDGEAFVGHVGGDDFVVVCPPGAAEPISQAIVDRFDAESPELYDDEDRERGYVEVTNRRGEMQRFPLLSISIGIATTDLRSYAHYAEAVAVATEMKSFTKASAGSSWALDRRTI